MSTHKYINKICVAVTLVAVLITVLFMNGKKLGLNSIVDEDSEAYEDLAYFTANDQNGDWDDSSATVITLNGDSAKITGNGAYVYDNQVVISGGGKYVFSGSLDDGSIVVDAYSSSKVYVKLNGVNVNCAEDACFRVNQADKVFLTLAEGTENSFESGETYSDEALEDNTGGVIFAHDDLTINGSGSLTVTANYKHGIDANDDLVITGGTLTINAPKDGLHVNDSLRIMNADITVNAEDDGVVVAKEEGYFYMESGTLNIISADDSIHTAGDVIIAGGEYNIAAGDDGIHSDTNISVSDGYLLISECYEGFEAITIDVSGGEIEIYPTDDGMNANGGSGDMFGMGGNFGGGNSDGNDFRSGMGGPGGGFNMNSQTDETQVTESQTDGTETDAQSEGTRENAASSDGTETGETQETESLTDGTEADGMQASQSQTDGTETDKVQFDTTQTSEANSNSDSKEESDKGGSAEASNASSDVNKQDMNADAETGETSETGDNTNNSNNAGMGQNNGNMQPPSIPDGTGSSENGFPATDGETTANADGISENNANADDASDNADDTASEEETYINITGGKITIINENGQDADGLDSNGSIYISGGEVYVSLSGNGTNNAIDYGSENSGICEINGGTVIACGGNGMVEEISDTSSQCSIMYNLESTSEANTTISLADSTGTELISYQVPCSYSSVVVSTPDMQLNETYTLTLGDIEEEITLESIAATYGTAVTTGGFGGMGGGMQGGGMQGGGRGGRGGFWNMNENTSTDGTANAVSSTDDSTVNTASNTDDSTAGTNDSIDSTSSDSDAVKPGAPPDMNGGTPPDMGDFDPSTMGNFDPSSFTPPEMGADGTNADGASTDGSAETTADGTNTDGSVGTDTSTESSTDVTETESDTKNTDSGEESGFHMGGGPQGMNVDQNFQQGQDMNSSEETTEEDTTEYSNLKEVTTEEWIWLGAAVGVLLLGLFVAVLYKRW